MEKICNPDRPTFKTSVDVFPIVMTADVPAQLRLSFQRWMVALSLIDSFFLRFLSTPTFNSYRFASARLSVTVSGSYRGLKADTVEDGTCKISTEEVPLGSQERLK